MNDLALYKLYNPITIPINGCNIDHRFLPKALPPAALEAGDDNVISPEVEVIEDDGFTTEFIECESSSDEFKAVLVILDPVKNSDDKSQTDQQCANPSDDGNSEESNQSEEGSINESLNSSENKEFDGEVEDESNQSQENDASSNEGNRKLDFDSGDDSEFEDFNVDVGENTTSGFDVDITNYSQKSDKIISEFLAMIKRRKKIRSIPFKSKQLDIKKALVDTQLRPHMIFTHRKIRPIKPKIYVLVDSHDSYYCDSGEFLNKFAETSFQEGFETWRAKKLSEDYFKEGSSKSSMLKGEMSHVDWAKRIGIKKGSIVVLVGDGCLGTTNEMYKKYIWSQESTDAFAKEYNPIWVHHFDEKHDCGCRPKRLAMASNWDAYYGIKNVKNLKPLL